MRNLIVNQIEFINEINRFCVVLSILAFILSIKLDSVWSTNRLKFKVLANPGHAIAHTLEYRQFIRSGLIAIIFNTLIATSFYLASEINQGIFISKFIH